MNSLKLKCKLVEAGVGQREFANTLGCALNTANVKINGKQPFNTNEIEEICMWLNIHDPVEIVDIFLPKLSQKRNNVA